jgi:hypothetical protein
MATSPSLWAGTLAKAPLKEPTGVRAADTMTTSSMERGLSFSMERGLSFLYCHAQNAANAPNGKLRRKSPFISVP